MKRPKWDKEEAAAMRKQMKAERLNAEFRAAKEEGYNEGYANGVKDGTANMKNDAFADLAEAWSQITQHAHAASVYAGIITNMYKRQVKVRADQKEKV